MNDLAKLRVCGGYCQMVGAAAALLTVEGSAVILNSPRWCALTAERTLLLGQSSYEQRLYCTEAKETDVLYGIEASLKATLEELLAEQSPSLVAVLNSCSLSLIGDDIKGICRKYLPQPTEIMALDAGGLSGGFASGYGLGQVALLRSLKLTRSPGQPRRINLLGLSQLLPGYAGIVAELQRLLEQAGYQVGLVLGAPVASREELLALGEASLNLVLVPELGLPAANYLNEQLGQPYLVAPLPYGLQGSLRWLKQVGAALRQPPDLEQLQGEAAEQSSAIAAAAYRVKELFKYFTLERVLGTCYPSQLLSLKQAMSEENLDILRVRDWYLKQDYQQAAEAPPKGLQPFDYLAELPPLGPSSYQLLLGNEKARVFAKTPARTLYFNFALPGGEIKSWNNVYVGLRGWSNFMQQLIEKIYTLEYINEGL